MVTAIQNQKVEDRKNTMVNNDVPNPGNVRRDLQNPAKGFSLHDYRSKIDRELVRHDQGLEDYAKALQILVHKKQKQKSSRILAFINGLLHRSSERQNVNSLVKQWKHSPEIRAEKLEYRRNKDEQLHLFNKVKRERMHEEGNFSARNVLRWRDPYRFPVAIAAFLFLVMVITNLLTPGSLMTGMLANSSIALPVPGEDNSFILQNAVSLNDDMINVDFSKIDLKKFQELSVQEYVIQGGDTLSNVAKRFNLNIDTIISVNNLTNPKSLPVGMKIKIPNRNGLIYNIAVGDSLASIAKKFSTDVIAILDANNMSDTAINPGSKLFIPDARMNPTDLKLLLGELFMWPAYGSYTSNFGYRPDPFTGISSFHNGIDIANSIGTPVRAGQAGKVVSVSTQYGNYGKVIVISHGRGFQTLYAHLSSFNVQVGQYVSQGQMIGRIGNTGKSTGPHLHFSVIRNGVFVSPLRYLK